MPAGKQVARKSGLQIDLLLRRLVNIDTRLLGPGGFLPPLILVE